MNIVAARARATLDIRYTEHDDPGEIVEAIRKVIKGKVTVFEQSPLFLVEILLILIFCKNILMVPFWV